MIFKGRSLDLESTMFAGQRGLGSVEIALSEKSTSWRKRLRGSKISSKKLDRKTTFTSAFHHHGVLHLCDVTVTSASVCYVSARSLKSTRVVRRLTRHWERRTLKIRSCVAKSRRFAKSGSARKATCWPTKSRLTTSVTITIPPRLWLPVYFLWKGVDWKE